MNTYQKLLACMNPDKRRLAACVVGCLWLASSTYGFWLLLEHDTSVENTADIPGKRVSLSVQNSVSQRSGHALSELIPDDGEIHVVVAIHPKCPCTRTTLAELDRLLTNTKTRTRCTVLATLPTTKPNDWLETATVEQAKCLPNSKLLVDPDSVRAAELELSHSGEILIIQDDGVVSFAGGITSGRTCTTANPGSETVAKLLQGETAFPISTPTFGCRLR